MKIDTPSFCIGAAVAILINSILLLGVGWYATNVKEEACTKFGAAIGEQTKFITFGLTESKCFTSINGQWTDINP